MIKSMSQVLREERQKREVESQAREQARFEADCSDIRDKREWMGYVERRTERLIKTAYEQ